MLLFISSIHWATRELPQMVPFQDPQFFRILGGGGGIRPPLGKTLWSVDSIIVDKFQKLSIVVNKIRKLPKSEYFRTTPWRLTILWHEGRPRVERSDRTQFFRKVQRLGFSGHLGYIRLNFWKNLNMFLNIFCCPIFRSASKVRTQCPQYKNDVFVDVL